MARTLKVGSTTSHTESGYMSILVLLIFVSLALVGGAVLFFAWLVKERSDEHADRLTLLPLQDDADRTKLPRENGRKPDPNNHL